MSYPGLTFALMVGVAIGTAIYYYFKNENRNHTYQYRDQDAHDYYVPPRTFEGCDTLPSKKKRRNSNIPQNCSICLEKLKVGKTKRMNCGHTFHDHCITMWLRTSSTCPNCRAEQL